MACRRGPAGATAHPRTSDGRSALLPRSKGTTNVKALPSPGALLTSRVPPMRLTILAAIDSPRPVPPKRREVEPSACVNASKMSACLSAGMPIPVSRTEARTRTVPGGSPGTRRRLFDVHAHAAFGGELDGVAHQIHQHLAEAARIAHQHRRQGAGHVHVEAQALAPGGHAQRLERCSERGRPDRTARRRIADGRPRPSRSRGCR